MINKEEERERLRKELLRLMYEAGQNSSNKIFTLFMNEPNKNLKPIYNLFAEAFLSLKGFAILINEKCWTQAGAILRIVLEQVSTLCLLSQNKTLIDSYLYLHDEKRKYWVLSNKDKENYLKELKNKEQELKNHKINKYFDYSWYKDEEGKYSKEIIIKAARLDELIKDVDNWYNKFAHGQISIFEFNNNNWEIMRRMGNRMTSSSFKLFDFLLYSFWNFFGKEKIESVNLYFLFVKFKLTYQSFFTTFKTNE